MATEKTVAERIKEAIELRKRADSKITQTRVERDAGLSQGELSTFLKRNSNKMMPAKLLAVAAALRVRYEWLSSGRGTMEGDPAEGIREERDQEYPTREPVLAALRVAGEPAELIAAIAAESWDTGDPGKSNESYWRERVDHYRSMLRKAGIGRREQKRWDEEDDEPSRKD